MLISKLIFCRKLLLRRNERATWSSLRFGMQR